MMLSREEALKKWREMTDSEKVALWSATGCKFTFAMFCKSSFAIQNAFNKKTKT